MIKVRHIFTCDAILKGRPCTAVFIRNAEFNSAFNSTENPQIPERWTEIDNRLFCDSHDVVRKYVIKPRPTMTYQIAIKGRGKAEKSKIVKKLFTWNAKTNRSMWSDDNTRNTNRTTVIKKMRKRRWEKKRK